MALSNRDTKALLDVHDFYLRILKQLLGHDVPIPTGLESLGKESTETLGPDSEAGLRRWLDLLDLAITAPMLRDAFKVQPRGTLAASLLYHYVNKGTHTDTDRDKADFIVTLLFRTPEASATTWDASGRAFGGEIIPPFEAFLLSTLGLTEAPFLPAEYQEMAREFNFIYEEIEDFRHFDQLIDSGIIQKARDLKNSLGAAFYHPHVLAMIAAYNVYFGKRFDSLFHAATKQIKEFAERLQKEGGSVMARVDGDVIVKQLADVQENKILQIEYGKAQDQLRMLSKFKKAVDIRRGTKETAAAAAAAYRQPVGGLSTTPKPATATGVDAAAAALGSGLSSSLDEIKLNSMADSIRNFVRGSEAKDTVSVPMRHGTIVLNAAETEAFRTDYSKEKSFRADLANVLVSNVTLLTRMSEELSDFKAKRNSAYLWKPHADSLSHLLNLAQLTLEKAEEVATTAEKRGLKDKADIIRMSIERVREEVRLVVTALQTMGTNQSGTY